MFISSVYSTKDIDKIISSNKKSLESIRWKKIYLLKILMEM
jgi:hypothetical protein